jgi:peptidoglycan/xylan/chitin deacetylase (PgdA/CDA1 family)
MPIAAEHSGVTRGPVALLYHAFSRPGRPQAHGLVTPVDSLRWQLEWLDRHGWRPLDLDGWLSAEPRRDWPPRSYLVTIDDGYVSALDVAAPVLREARVPALLFVCADLVGRKAPWDDPVEPFLDAAALRACPDNGIEVGLHGADHRSLVGLEPAELARQTVQARAHLEETLCAPVRTFAYPYGAHDGPARAAVAAAGMRPAFAVEVGSGRVAVRRTMVRHTETRRTFGAKMLPGYGSLRQLAEPLPRLRNAARRLLEKDGR